MSFNLHQAQSHDILRSWQSHRTDFSHHKEFVLPLFIGNEDSAVEVIEAMPGINRYGCDRAIEYLEPLVDKHGLRAVLLFPVITKSDQVKLKMKHSRIDDDEDEDDEDEDEDDSDVSSSASSSSSVASSSSLDSEDERRRKGAEGAAGPSEPAASQNPFLNEPEREEEAHLLGEQGGAKRASSAVGASGKARPGAAQAGPQTGGPLRKNSKSLDVKLIKALALKDNHNPVLRLIPILRAKFPELLIICDVCLCAFTSTGHCCLFDDHLGGVRNGQVHYQNRHMPSSVLSHLPISNKITCQYLAMLATEYASRGCNVVAPSDMMDGRIMAIREKLDENRLSYVSIMSYSAKFASAFYGPFRSAAQNAPEFGDRRSYQLPPGSRALAMKAVRRDIQQGADIIMVKPASPYLDIVRDIRENHPEFPLAVYQVSGEFAMLKLAAQAGIIDLRQALNELLASYRRAGATIIISYFTPEILRGEL